MKKIVAGAVAVGCLTVAGMSLAATPNVAGSGVNGSLHDMTRVVPATADVMGRVCVYCHAPHHADKGLVEGDAMPDSYPLWNHKFSGETFVPYTWATPGNQLAAGDITDPLAGPSRLCMTCHDGSVAIDEHGTTPGGTWNQAGGTLISTLNGGRANLTADLSNTHPIGFNYNDVATARNLKSAQGGDATVGTEIVLSGNKYASKITLSTVDGTYNTIERAQGGKTIADNLFGDNIMTCATCHEVHNKENVVQDAFTNNAADRPNYFLYAKQTDSLICLSCHVK